MTRIDSFEFGRATTRFGELEFRGGLELDARDSGFGGFSGLDFDPRTGDLVAIADTGAWLTLRPIEDDGRLVGVASAAIAPVLNLDGKPVRHKDESDSEAIRFTRRDGRPVAMVAVEEANQVRVYDAGTDLSRAVPTLLPLPDEVAHLIADKGLETLAIAPTASPLGGATVLVSEGALDSAGNNRAWILDGPLQGAFAVKRHGRPDATDGVFLANGDLILLERSFSLANAFGVRIRHIKGADIKPGATVDGDVLMEADMRFQIDNMEGLAAKELPDETDFYIISDDNHSILERTLLLKFAWHRPA